LAATGDEGEQREMSRALDGDGEGTLALRGETGLAARLDLAALRKKPSQTGDILVVNLVNAVSGEDVHATAATTAATAPAIIGSGRAGFAWRAVVRSPLRALLISHGPFLLQSVYGIGA